MHAKRPTLKDVASEAGVSIMTVSAVLNGSTKHVRVSHETRQRVLETAYRLNYRANAMARSLRRNRSDVYGFYSGYPYLGMDVPFVHSVVSGLMDGCNGCGRQLLIYGDHHADAPEKTFARLTDRRTDGLILWTTQDDPLIPLLASSSMGAVSIEAILPGIPSIVADEKTAARELLDHLVEKGHTAIAMFAKRNDEDNVLPRCRAIIEHAAELCVTLEVDFEDGWKQAWTDEGWQPLMNRFFANWLDGPASSRATALICWCDHRAYYLLRLAQDAGLSVPDEVAITGFDGLPPPRGFSGVLTTVMAPWHDVAKEAVCLLETIEAGGRAPAVTVLPACLILGETA